MKRYMALDIGEQRTGLALVDDSARLATPIGTIDEPLNSQSFLQKLVLEINEWKPEDLIVGLPIDLKGEESVAVENLKKSVENIIINIRNIDENIDLEVHYVDERLTTKQAERSMQDQNVSAESRKQHRDSLAATLIAQSFIESL